jgi:preprotein translocase subunit Sec63
LISGPDLIRWIDGSYSARCAAQNPQQQKPKSDTNGLFDPFSVLGIRRGANQEEVRAAYRQKMSKYHPDKVAHLGSEFQQLAERKAQAINRAYTELLRQN